MKLEHDPEIIFISPRQCKAKCCICSKYICLSSRGNKNGSYGWIISNFTNHLMDHERLKLKGTIGYFFGQVNNTDVLKEQDCGTSLNDKERKQDERGKQVFETQKQEEEQAGSEIRSEENLHLERDLGDDNHNKSEDIIVYDPESDGNSEDECKQSILP